tara:strand:+ start:83 stop:418 length:336 start_codon:yes stop_codon:yes gene_type:complete
MISKTTQLQIETDCHMEEDGVGVSIWTGANACDPSVETVFSFEALIEEHFENYTVGDNMDIRPIDIPDAERLVIKLEQMALYARNMLEDYAHDAGVLPEIEDPKPNSKYFA